MENLRVGFRKKWDKMSENQKAVMPGLDSIAEDLVLNYMYDRKSFAKFKQLQ
jgi:hypothetical protein